MEFRHVRYLIGMLIVFTIFPPPPLRAYQQFSSHQKFNEQILFIFHRPDLCAWAIIPIYFTKPYTAIFTRWLPKKLLGMMNCGLDRIQILSGGSLGISDDLINLRGEKQNG